jgi:hypothetical protein
VALWKRDARYLVRPILLAESVPKGYSIETSCLMDLLKLRPIRVLHFLEDAGGHWMMVEAIKVATST